MSYSLYNKLLPFALRQNDPDGAIKAIVDGAQQGFDELRGKALALPTIVDIDQAPGNLLAYLAYEIGVELETGDAEGLRREQIRSAISVYKIKGTDFGYTALLRTFGFQVDIVHLYEDEPDSVATKDEFEVITGFNERLPGWHAASRIKISFYRLPEAQNLEISGIANGMLTSYLLQRILDKIHSITPIHIEALVVFVWEAFDILEILDSASLAADELSCMALGSCCYHGRGADIVWVRYAYQYDTGITYDDLAQYDLVTDYAPARLYDSIYCYFDSNYSYHWNYPEYYYDLLPDIWRACCTRGEENAYNLTRWWYTKMENLGVEASAGSDIVTVVDALKPDVEAGDFVNIDYNYWRITAVIDTHTLQLDRPMPESEIFVCNIEWIESWHRRSAMHKDAQDFTLPAYVRAVMPTYRVMYDIPGFLYDDDLHYDMTGMKHDSCNMEQMDIITTPMVTTLQSSLPIEFAYYREFPAEHSVQMYVVSGAISQIKMPVNGNIIGLTLSASEALTFGTITATPTIDEVELANQAILVLGENSQTIAINETFFSGVKIGVILESSVDYAGGGDIFVTLFLELD